MLVAKLRCPLLVDVAMLRSRQLLVQQVGQLLASEAHEGVEATCARSSTKAPLLANKNSKTASLN